MFPVYGKCPVCGGAGADAPVADLNTGIHSTSDLDTTGNGLPLVPYEGRYIGEDCRKILIAREESILDAQRHEETQEFLSSAGVRRTPE